MIYYERREVSLFFFEFENEYERDAEIDYLESMLTIKKAESQYLVESSLIDIDDMFTEAEKEAAVQQKSESAIGNFINRILEGIKRLIQSVKDAFKNIFGIGEHVTPEDYFGSKTGKQMKVKKDPNKVIQFFDNAISKGETMMFKLIKGDKVTDEEIEEYSSNPGGTVENFFKGVAGATLTTVAGFGIAKGINHILDKDRVDIEKCGNALQKAVAERNAQDKGELQKKGQKILSAISSFASARAKSLRSFGGSLASFAGKNKSKDGDQNTNTPDTNTNQPVQNEPVQSTDTSTDGNK